MTYADLNQAISTCPATRYYLVPVDPRLESPMSRAELLTLTKLCQQHLPTRMQLRVVGRTGLLGEAGEPPQLGSGARLRAAVVRAWRDIRASPDSWGAVDDCTYHW